MFTPNTTTRFVSFPVCLGTREQEICGLCRIIILGNETKVRGLKSEQTAGEEGTNQQEEKGQKWQQKRGRPAAAAAFGFDFNCVDLS